MVSNPYLLRRTCYNVAMRNLFTSPYCVGIFTITFIAELLILPRHIFTGYLLYLGVIFALLFALNITCFIRAMRERVRIARANGAGLISIIATVLGISALQVCGVGGAHICGAALGAGLITALLPAGAVGLFTDYAVYLVIGAIIAQCYSLYLMRCIR